MEVPLNCSKPPLNQALPQASSVIFSELMEGVNTCWVRLWLDTCCVRPEEEEEDVRAPEEECKTTTEEEGDPHLFTLFTGVGRETDLTWSWAMWEGEEDGEEDWSKTWKAIPPPPAEEAGEGPRTCLGEPGGTLIAATVPNRGEGELGKVVGPWVEEEGDWGAETGGGTTVCPLTVRRLMAWILLATEEEEDGVGEVKEEEGTAVAEVVEEVPTWPVGLDCVLDEPFATVSTTLIKMHPLGP
jgi:hypothetical protein